MRTVGWLLLASVATGCAAPPPRAIAKESVNAAFFKLFSPRCGTAESLEVELRADESLLVAAANHLTLPIADLPTTAWQGGQGLPREGYMAAVLAGHGASGAVAASICLDAQLDGPSTTTLEINALAAALPRSLRGAVLIVNACRSAHVDPRQSAVPLSVISASPFTVRTDAMFGSTLPEALLAAAADPNCDGLVTDQELFDNLTLRLRQSPPLSDRPAFPKLRRNATSEIPLPVAPTPTKDCRDRRLALEALIAARSPGWGELGEALRTQVTLARSLELRRDAPLPKADHDYFVLEIADAEAGQRTRALLEGAGLQAVPDDAIAHVERLASYMIFADIFRVRESCGWQYLSRVKDDTLLATAPLGESLRVPRRQRIEFSASNKQPVYWRSGVVDDHELVATPCFSSAGQCFEMPTSVGGKAEP